MTVQALKLIARRDNLPFKAFREKIESGRIIIVKNKRHRIRPLAIGEGLKTRINANIGTSPDLSSLPYELKKLKIAIEAGADTVMDLSTGGDIRRIRRAIVKASSVPIGTVPIYEAAIAARKRKKSFMRCTPDEIFGIIEDQLVDGVDFITVHCGINRESIRGIKRRPRLCGVVSRGGSMIIEWMEANGRENPLYEDYDRLLALAKKYDAALSLGDGLRPGSVIDATDRYQIRELLVIGELVRRARKAGVSAMVEGPGHVPIHQIKTNIRLEKAVCDGAPFYVLGPLVTDIGAGHDHIVGAIGGALAAYYGADFLCYVTPSEHLGLPNVEEVRDGVIASRIAAHAADIGKGIPGAIEIDRRLSRARYELDWKKVMKLLLDPRRAQKIYSRRRTRGGSTCTMCGEFCAMKKTREVLDR
jgi:phosphomethylpyrimidine synthase